MRNLLTNIMATLMIIFIMFFQMDQKRVLSFAKPISGQKMPEGMIPWFPEEKEENHFLNINFHTESIHKQFDFTHYIDNIDENIIPRGPELPQPKQEFEHGRDYIS